MKDVVTDLLGEIVEVWKWEHGSSSGMSLAGRGTVRAVYAVASGLTVLVEHNLGYDSAAYGLAEDGGCASYTFSDCRVRVVQRCARCFSWDLKARMRRCPKARVNKIFGCTWEHKDGEGCQKRSVGAARE
jgi:hypothetical protein